MPNSSSSNSIRIIGGEYRSRTIQFTVSKSDKGLLRPTGNRVRETLFNWLNYDVVQARVLDLFAGSGALGFEALSRGASYVHFIEKNPFYSKQIANNGAILNCKQRIQITNDDALQWLEKKKNDLQTFNLIFLDPPFLQGYYYRILDLLSVSIDEGCLVYIECSQQHDIFYDVEFDIQRNWRIIKYKSIGNVRIAIVAIKKDENGNLSRNI